MRHHGLLASLALLFSNSLVPVHAQTWSSCNPLTRSDCPANSALGMTIDVDFQDGEVDIFAASGSPSYDDDGVIFTVSRGGDAPQLTSLFYIMFGRVEITMKAAPGAGIVSSLVLESDTLDEIDIEWLGSQPGEIQSNYFGKGQVTDYNRGQFHQTADSTQDSWIKYTVDWTEDRVIWLVEGTAVRTLTKDDAADNQYPQTPMRVKFGAWAGGDPNYNAPGTVKWAEGPTDYTQGPFSMRVRDVLVTDYSTGKEYRYTDNSGSWESIEAVDGKVNGNAGNNNGPTVTASAEGSRRTGDASVPIGGMGSDENSDSDTQTTGSVPEGWTWNDKGKLVRENPSSAALLSSPAVALCGALLAALVFA